MLKLVLPNQTELEVESITAKELVDKYSDDPKRVMTVAVGYHHYELNETIKNSGLVLFANANTMSGNQAYRSGLAYVFASAIIDELGNNVNYRIQASINFAFYIWFEDLEVTKELVERIKNRMLKIISEDHKFEKTLVYRLEALNYFKKMNRTEKVKLLRYLTNTFVSLYKLNDKYDYFYNKMPYSTGQLTMCELDFVDERGMLLKFPNVYYNGEELTINEQTHLFEVYRKFSKWTDNLGIVYASDLNEYVTSKDINELIRIEEARHNNELFKVSETIANSDQHIKVIMIAGPSSSGKTTTSKKLAVYLKGQGYDVKVLGCDDYFKERVDTPKDEYGDYDYDNLAAIDVELFNRHLEELFRGEEVSLPSYNFLTGVKEYKNKTLKLQRNSILIIEGIHALNDEMSASIESSHKFRIYISPLAQLNLDKNNTISYSDIRLLRRIVRDRKYRGNDVAATIDMWPNVRRAEEKYIYHYQAHADIILNTTLLYEVGALRTLAQAYLYEITEDMPQYEKVKSLLNFLSNFLPFPTDAIPPDSLLREFIGGSCYE